MARDTILVVNNDELSNDLIKQVFVKEPYKVDSCSSAKDALAYLTKNHKNIAAILFEIVMPEVDGIMFLRVLNKKGITEVIPCIAVTAENDSKKIVEIYKYGAADIILKPFIPVVVKARVENAINLSKTKNELKDIINKQTSQIKEQNKSLRTYSDRLVEVMSTIVEFRNLEPDDHIKRIRKMTKIMGTMCLKLYPEKYNLTARRIEVMQSAAALHDIGKIAISDSILLKPGRLTDDEFEVIKSHTTMGIEVLSLIGEIQDKEYMEMSKNICRHHHERYDGNGYPDKLSGEDIPIEAQIVSIVDVYDSLVADRIYRDGFDKEKAFNMIMNGECGVFSEEILTCFSKSKSLLEKVDTYVEGE